MRQTLDGVDRTTPRIPRGTIDGQQLEWDQTSKSFSIHVPHGGSAWPARVYTGRTWFRTDRDVEYIRNSSGVWVPLVGAGAITMYVDSVNGTDDADHGFSSGTGALKTLMGASYGGITQIPATNFGDVELNISGHTFSENVLIQGKDLKGTAKITIAGTLTLLKSGTVGAGSVAGTGATQGSVVDNTGGMTVNGYQNKILRFKDDTTTAGLRGVARLIDSNTATTFTMVATWQSVTPASGDTYEVYDWATQLAGGGATFATQVVNGQKAVFFKNLYFNNASAQWGMAANIQAQAIAYQCRIKGTHGGAITVGQSYLSLGHDPITDAKLCGCIIESGAIETASAFRMSYLDIRRSKLISTAANVSLGRSMLGSTVLVRSSICEGNIGTYAGVTGFYNDDSLGWFQNVDAEGYAIIRNCATGLYAINGGKNKGTSLNVYSGNTTDENPAGAAIIGYND